MSGDGGAPEEAQPKVTLASAPGRAAMPDWYGDLLASVVQRIAAGRTKAVLAANQQMIATYWAIGQDILDRQHAQGWGSKVIDRLSADLRRNYPEAKGFSPRNLQYMRAFAAAWPDLAIVQRSAAQLPWRQHQLLLDRLSDGPTRLWYARKAMENGWSRDVLDLQIDRRLHARAGKAITNFAAVVPPTESDMAQQATKDPYVIDFIGAADKLGELEIERKLIEHVEEFLLELGQGFAFVGRQRRLVVGGDEFYPDLLFYHYKLRCFVVIELKAVAFQPGFIGQLGMYMAAIDDVIAHPDDKPTIGLLLCKTKNNVVAEYALRNYSAPIGVAAWTTTVTENLPAELASSLPSIEALEAELTDLDEDAT